MVVVVACVGVLGTTHMCILDTSLVMLSSLSHKYAIHRCITTLTLPHTTARAMASGRSTKSAGGQYQSAAGHAKTTLSVVDVPALYPYSNSVSLRLTDIQQQHYDNVVLPHTSGQMAGALDEAQYLQWMCTLTNAQTVVEVGVFVGSTTLAIALSPAVTKIYGLDINTDYTSLGEPYWRQAGVDKKIELMIGSADKSMQQLIDNGVTVDMIFIDADKDQYDTYYELALKLVKQNGVIAIDNVYRHGDVLRDVGAVYDSAGTRVVQELNKKIHTDSRVDITILPLADGLTLCRKK